MPMTNQSIATRRSSAAAKPTGQHPLRLLLSLYREDWGKLALASLIYIVKHSPVWIMPLITADIIKYYFEPRPDWPRALMVRWCFAVNCVIAKYSNPVCLYSLAEFGNSPYGKQIAFDVGPTTAINFDWFLQSTE